MYQGELYLLCAKVRSERKVQSWAEGTLQGQKMRFIYLFLPPLKIQRIAIYIQEEMQFVL